MTAPTYILWLFSALLFISTPQTAPAPPSACVAVPDYKSSTIEVRWRYEARDAYRFDVMRSVDGGAYSKIATVPADQAVFADTSVAIGVLYAYGILAVGPAGISTMSISGVQSLKTVWPIPASHEILHNWNEPIGDAGVGNPIGPPMVFPPTGFHRGVDIQRSGSNNKVRAARGGRVVSVNDGPNGHVIVRVSGGAGQHGFEYDEYNHLGVGVAVQQDDIVSAGKTLGSIDESGWFGGVHFVDHCHFDQTMSLFGAAVERHPLLVFTTPADRDPHEQLPALLDHPGSPPGTLLFQRQGAPTGQYLTYDATHPLSGDLDIVVEIADEMGSNPEQVPVTLGYWIEAPTVPGCLPSNGVGTFEAPYRLFDFAHAYFGSGQLDLALSKLVADESQNYQPLIAEGSEVYPWPHYYHLTVTNAKGGSGSPTNVDGTQCWNTNARDDGVDVTDVTANYAGKPDAASATEARFADGTYSLHIIAGDLIHSDTDITQHIRIDNYSPVVCSALPAGVLPLGATSTLGSVYFSEPMNTDIAPSSILSVNNGAQIVNPSWLDNHTLTFEITNITGAQTYTITVSALATDLPGTPGGNSLDGNYDGVGGDNYSYGFVSHIIPLVPTDSRVGSSIHVFDIAGWAPEVFQEVHPQCLPTTITLAPVFTSSGYTDGTASATVAGKVVAASATGHISGSVGSGWARPQAWAEQRHTLYFYSPEVGNNEPVYVLCKVAITAELSLSSTPAVSDVGYSVKLDGHAWGSDLSAVGSNYDMEFPIEGTGEITQSIMLINGMGWEVYSAANIDISIQAISGGTPQNCSAAANYEARWLGVESASTLWGDPIRNYTLIDGCGNDWTGP